MCELMAVSSRRPISAGFALREFGPRSEENPDGWGLGWYSDQSLALIKEPVKWSASPLARFLEASPDALGRIHLAHVRHKTVGDSPSHADTHPFSREMGGRDYCFAHNGTLEGAAWDLPLGRFAPVGETDSERFFCHLLHEVENRGAHLDNQADWGWLHEKLSASNGFGKLNVLMSDGHRLFVYHDMNGWKGLNFLGFSLESNPPDRMDQIGTARDDGDDSLCNGQLIATCPLSRAGWTSFQLGELIVFEAGTICYSSHRKF